MYKVLGFTLARLHTRNFVIVIPYHRWKELVNVIHLYILLCHTAGPIRQCYAFPSIFRKNCFIFSNLRIQYLRYPSSYSSRPIPGFSGSLSLLNQSNGTQMARTIPRRSHYIWKSLETVHNLFCNDAWKSSNKHLHNWIYKHQEVTYKPCILFNFSLKTQGDLLQNACSPFFLCRSKWALQSKSYNLKQRQRRERAKIMNANVGYIRVDLNPSLWTLARVRVDELLIQIAFILFFHTEIQRRNQTSCKKETENKRTFVLHFIDS
jgi:hypothetical protein